MVNKDYKRYFVVHKSHLSNFTKQKFLRIITLWATATIEKALTIASSEVRLGSNPVPYISDYIVSRGIHEFFEMWATTVTINGKVPSHGWERLHATVQIPHLQQREWQMVIEVDAVSPLSSAHFRLLWLSRSSGPLCCWIGVIWKDTIEVWK